MKGRMRERWKTKLGELSRPEEMQIDKKTENRETRAEVRSSDKEEEEEKGMDQTEISVKRR